MLNAAVGSPRISLASLPRPARPDDYQRASEEIEGLLGRLPGIVAVYRAGSVSTPGISDLDRIAVVEGSTRVPSVWPHLSEQSKYLALHTPFLVDRPTFRRHRSFAFVEPLQLSFGSGEELEERPCPEYSEPLLGAESLVVGLLSVLKQISTGRFKVRSSLCQLNNLRHALALARVDRREAPAAWDVADDVASLRGAWFDLPDRDRLDRARDIGVRSAPALLEALWALGESTEPATRPPSRMKLGAPWSNVTLVAASPKQAVTRTPRIRLPFSGSARLAEARWRAARPRISLHPGVVSTLAGSRDHEHQDFRSTRDRLVRGYAEFLAANGRHYSPIGFASPFLPR